MRDQIAPAGGPVVNHPGLWPNRIDNDTFARPRKLSMIGQAAAAFDRDG